MPPINLPSHFVHAGTAYYADGRDMTKLVGGVFSNWGVSVHIEQGAAAEGDAGALVAGTYLIHIIPVANSGAKGNPYLSDSDPQPISVTIDASKKIDMTIPVHPDPQVKFMQIYRTRVGETAPFFFAGEVTNGTLVLTLNGDDDTLPTLDFLEAPTIAGADADALAGPFRYGRPPSKLFNVVGFDEIAFVFGEKAYTEGTFAATDASNIFEGNSAVRLVKGMEGKTLRFINENIRYEIEEVQTSTRFKATANYARPSTETVDPSISAYEIIGNGNIVAPSAPGQLEHFSPSEQFSVGEDGGGVLRGGISDGNSMLLYLDNRIYLAIKGFNPGTFETKRTASVHGTRSHRSIALTSKGVVSFDGQHITLYRNQTSQIISEQRLGDTLVNAVEEMKQFSISAVLGDILYFAIALQDNEFLDTIFRFDLETGAWDEWGPFRIVDMAVRVSGRGDEYLYMETKTGDGYALHAFRPEDKSDGVGSIDYSGTVVSASGGTVTVDQVLPTFGLGLKGLYFQVVAGVGEGQSAWIKSNTKLIIQLESTLLVTLDTTSKYTIGAINVDLLTAKLGYPDGHIEQTIKNSELRYARK